jgi:large subunit ribosomal protein L3
MKKAILAKKLGMTQVFAEDGTMVSVTVLEAGPCQVVQRKTIEKDGYAALQVGFGKDVSVPMPNPKRPHPKPDKGNKAKPNKGYKAKHVSKPQKGHFEANLGVGGAMFRILREFRLDDTDQFDVGAEIKADVFSPGDNVDVSGISKGKGFQGPIKRHNKHRGPMAHGSKYHRGPGSLGAGTTPGRVRKGQKMAGHMGAKKITVQNLEVVRADAEKNLLLIKGAVPGIKGAVVMVKSTVKE